MQKNLDSKRTKVYLIIIIYLQIFLEGELFNSYFNKKK